MTSPRSARTSVRFARRVTASAETLALFRMAVAFALFTSSELHGAVRYAALAPEHGISVPTLTPTEIGNNNTAAADATGTALTPAEHHAVFRRH
jgi:hypothetical protein